MITLPEILQFEFKTELKRYEKGKRMPFLTSFEIDGMIKNSRELVIDILEMRFGDLSEELKNQIEVIGSWKGEPCELPEQPPFEEREEIQLAKFVGILSDSETKELQQVIKDEFE